LGTPAARAPGMFCSCSAFCKVQMENQMLIRIEEQAERKSYRLISLRGSLSHADLESFQQAIIEDPAMISERDPLGRTHLHDAASFGHLELVSFLLAHGAEIDAKAKSGKTPLHWAVQMSHRKVTEALLDHSADINVADNSGKTPLHLAAHNGDEIIVEMLLKNLAEVNSSDNYNDTPLKYAARRGHATIVNQLRLQGGVE